MANYPEKLGQSEFARLINRRPSYVTQLKQSGVLVMASCGRLVMVRESLDAIEAHRNPAFDGVAERHAAAREAVTVTPEATVAPSLPPAASESTDEPEDDISQSDAARRIKIATAKEKEIDVKLAEIKFAQACGELLYAAEVRQSVATASTELRHALDRLVDDLSPRLAAVSDEGRVRAMLTDAVTVALESYCRKLDAVAGVA